MNDIPELRKVLKKVLKGVLDFRGVWNSASACYQAKIKNVFVFPYQL